MVNFIGVKDYTILFIVFILACMLEKGRSETTTLGDLVSSLQDKLKEHVTSLHQHTDTQTTSRLTWMEKTLEHSQNTQVKSPS